MNTKKLNLNCSSDQEEMVRSLLGKSYITSSDYQNLWNTLLFKAFQTSKGKKLS